MSALFVERAAIWGTSLNVGLQQTSLESVLSFPNGNNSNFSGHLSFFCDSAKFFIQLPAAECSRFPRVMDAQYMVTKLWQRNITNGKTEV
jgi:hypothetical protein